jgi:ribulose-phosphate 3-epimerase
VKIAPSMLACDFTKMGEELRRVCNGGADYLHLDVMDGCFVPNISFGPAVISALRPLTQVPFDVHLMVDRPGRYLNEFLSAGANILTIHAEAEPDLHDTLRAIRAGGAKAGLSIKPATPAEAVFPYLEDTDLILVMTVEPGFGGQSFQEAMMGKVRALRAELYRRSLSALLEVDGGINTQTIGAAARAGAEVAVAGTSVFRSADAGAAIRELREAAFRSTGV